MSAVPHLTAVNTYNLGPIAFRPSADALTHTTGVDLGIRGPNGAWHRFTLPAPIVDLSYEKREVYGEALIPTDEGVVQILTQTYMDGTGVFNELSPIQHDCTLGEALFEQSAPVASVSVGGHRWIARTVLYTGGPSRAAGELWQAPNAKRLAHGESPAQTAAWLPGKQQIAVERDLVTMATGAVQKDVLPDAVVGVDPQGKVWVLRDGGPLRVYTAQ